MKLHRIAQNCMERALNQRRIVIFKLLAHEYVWRANDRMIIFKRNQRCRFDPGIKLVPLYPKFKIAQRGLPNLPCIQRNLLRSSVVCSGNYP